MPITDAQKALADGPQQAIAQDPAARVRVVAGPGTGKSAAIEKRVCWLLNQGVAPERIYVVSFTRASSLDLRSRVRTYCAEAGIVTADRVSVGTLHSLALKTLESAGLLLAYPVDPQALDEWEIENVFDAEYISANGGGRKRCREVCLHYEAYCSTGQWGPPNYIPPNPPVTPAEDQLFAGFHTVRSQAYSSVLPEGRRRHL